MNLTQELYQEIEVKFTPTASKEKALNLQEFLTLLRNEEDYFTGEQHNTKLMTTRLRKIFYDAYGWNKELIRGAAKIPGRYEVKVVPTGEAGHMKREVVVREGDWMNPNTDSVPEIYSHDNQEIILPSGLYCDMGHVLAGMDCYNYPAPVSPLPNFLIWAHKLLPYGEHNIDISTWVGDISSSSGEFLFSEIYKDKDLTREVMQTIINQGCPGQDMLGNIDSYVISESFDISTNEGMRVTDIFEEYYTGGYRTDSPLRNRIPIYCESVGLKNWDGEKFSNEKDWIKYYKKQLRNTTTFYIGTRFPSPAKYWYALMTWFRVYDNEMKLDVLLEIYLNALKKIIINEPKKISSIDNA